MDQVINPSKQQVRDWLRNRQIDRRPIPDREQIRHELDWKPRASKKETSDVILLGDILATECLPL